MMFYQYPALGEEYAFQEFCKDIFNEFYQSNDFQQYKTKGAAQHGIDSYSLNSRVVIQSKKKKLLRSDKDLEKELINDLYDTVDQVKGLPFTFVILIFATNTKRYSVIEDLCITLSESVRYQIKFFSWEDFEPLITKFSNIRQIYYPIYYQGQNKYPKILSHLPTIDSSIVIGRVADVLSIKTLLPNSINTIVVNGMGGIGKTTLLKQVVKELISEFDHILWIDHPGGEDSIEQETGLMRALTENITLLKNLNLNLSNDLSLKQMLSIVINKLNNIEGRNLLVIDNAPQSYVNLKQNLVGYPNWKTLLSSRDKIAGTQHIDLSFLSAEDALSLFYKYYLIEKNDFTVNQILAFVGNHTLTIELISKTANKRRITLSQLRYALKNEGLNISKSAKVLSDHDQSQTPSNYFKYLSEIFSIARLTTIQQDTLTKLALMPCELIPYDNLKLLFGVEEDDNDFFENINSLSESGWLIQLEDLYQMHQVIQEVVREKLKPDELLCISLMTNLSDKLFVSHNQNPFNVRKFTDYGESLISFISGQTIEFANLCNALGMRSEDFNHLEKAINYYHKAETIFKNNGTQYLPELAGIYNNLQSAYKTSGQIELAFNYQLRAIEIQENGLNSFDDNLASSYNNIALLYQVKGEIQNALTFMTRSITIAENYLLNDDPLLASSYAGLANIYDSMGEDEQAFEFQLKAYEMRLRILEKDHPLIDESRNNMAALYSSRGELDLAEDLIKISIAYKEAFYGYESFRLGASYTNLAAIYIERDKFEEAESYQRKAIALEEAGLGENHHEVGISYSTLAVIKNSQKDHNAAILFAQKAIAIFRLNFPEGHSNIPMYEQFIRIVKSQIPSISAKVSRNEPCYCGSGKKCKYCCG